jgi:hypothetical protein
VAEVMTQRCRANLPNVDDLIALTSIDRFGKAGANMTCPDAVLETAVPGARIDQVRHS